MNPVSAILKSREVAAATYTSAAGCVQEIGLSRRSSELCRLVGSLLSVSERINIPTKRFGPSVKNAAYQFNSRDNAG